MIDVCGLKFVDDNRDGENGKDDNGENIIMVQRIMIKMAKMITAEKIR